MSVPPRRRDSRLLTKSALVWLILPWILIWAAAWYSLSALSYQRHTGMSYIDDLVNAELHRQAQEQNLNGVKSTDLAKEVAAGEQLDSLKVHMGSKVARSMNFIAICFAELWLVLTFSDAQALSFFSTKNMYLLMSTIVMGCVALIAVYSSEIEFIGKITGFVMLAPEDLSIALGFSVGAILILEIFKVGYRSEVCALNELRQYHAFATSKGLLSADATDAQVEAYRAQHPLEDLQREIV